jgi:hypothetical protein
MLLYLSFSSMMHNSYFWKQKCSVYEPISILIFYVIDIHHLPEYLIKPRFLCFAILLIFYCIPLKTFFFTVGKLDLDFNLDLDGSVALPQTPAAQPTRPARSRRRVRIEEDSSDESSPPSVVPTTQQTAKSRSQRASKTAAMNKMSACRSLKIDEIEEQEEDDSDVTSEDSDESDQYS